MTFDVHSHLHSVNELLKAGKPFATVTLVDIRGSAPQIQGAKAIISHDGIISGTVGGGKIEARAIEHAQQMLSRGDGRRCEFVTWNLQTEIGMTCGGEVKFFFELTLCNDWHIALFGAGHIAQALVPILMNMHCRVTWLDQRHEWLSRQPDHPKLTKICCDALQEQVASLDPKSFFVLMTQGHGTDLPVLAEILKTIDPPYIGVLGSIQKAKVIKRDLINLGFDDEHIARYYCPMGMPIGNNTPAEIAISVVAQLIQERDRQGLIQQKTKKF